MDTQKKLKKIDLDLSAAKDNISANKLRLEQLEHQRDEIICRDRKRERKERTHRLILRGIMLEKYILNAENMTNEDVENILRNTFEVKG